MVAILDNQDAEGWMRMIAGPAAPHLNPTADWPSAGPPPDAALVCAEAWTADDPHVVRLREYLEAGGRALVFGVPAPGIEPLIPVTVARDALNPEKPLRLGRLSADAALWADFRAENGPPHYALRAVARPGATVLASWEDGTHAVVGGRGRGGRAGPRGPAPTSWHSGFSTAWPAERATSSPCSPRPDARWPLKRRRAVRLPSRCWARPNCRPGSR